MLDSIVQLYRNYRHELKVPNPETYRRSQIRGLLFVGLLSDLLFALSYLAITLTNDQFNNDTLPVIVTLVFFAGIGALAIINTKLFDHYGGHLLICVLLVLSFTLVPHVSSALFLVMLVKVIILSGVLTRPVFTWIYSVVGYVMFAFMTYGHSPAVQIFGFTAIYIYVTVAGFLVAEMLNSLFAMNMQSSNSMQQLYLDDKKLFSSLAHRLKTPVAILRGQLLHNKTTQNDPEILVPLDEITAAINELTVLSKMNLSKALATKQRLDLTDVLQEVVHDAEILAANHERLYGEKRIITFTKRSYKVRPVAYVAPQQFKEALLNIIDNSIRHNTGRKLVHVTVSLQSRNKKYSITIEDDGIGISEERLRDVLAKRTIVGDDKSPIDMHVGLEISRNLITANNGEMYIYSEHGQGTTVEVLLTGD